MNGCDYFAARIPLSCLDWRCWNTVVNSGSNSGVLMSQASLPLLLYVEEWAEGPIVHRVTIARLLK